MSETFFDRVYKVTRLIPKGRVSSYGAIARYAGSGKAARMVGYAMNRSEGLHPPVPAHRVVNRYGILSGKKHFGDINIMQSLLEQEGVEIIEDQIQDFGTVFWDPNVELRN